MISLTSASPKPKKPGQKVDPGPVKKTEKELDQFRKSGAGPQVLSDDGKELNPYIPHFISAVPWFYKTDKPTLRHQSDPCKSRPTLSDIHEAYIKGVPTGEAPIKFKAGSCENCGSMSHKKKDCLERPRKIGAKYTNKDLKPADFVQPKLKLDFEGKRDRWAGYNPDDYTQVIEEFEEIEKAKKELKARRLEEDLANGVILPEKDDSEDEKYAEDSNIPGIKFDESDYGTVRNLRIREDTAKYLYNLDPDSAFYDPKSRSMRENPLTGAKGQLISFKGDDIHRKGEQMFAVSDATNFTLSAHDKGIDVNLLTDPTKSEMLMKQFNARKEALYNTQQKELLHRYGGEEHLYAPTKEILFDQCEEYVEYSKTGTVVKGQERIAISSKYTEDIFHNNHTSVWGSYWFNFQWGYMCCHSFLKNSYCTGILPDFTPTQPTTTHENEDSCEEESLKRKTSSKKVSSTTQTTPDKKAKTSKSKYHVIHDVALPTEQEMEEYRMKRPRMGDPIFQNNDKK